MPDEFDQLNQKIEKCTLCQGLVTELKKTQVKKRGGVSPVMIIGRNPGTTELASETPFSGLSGKKLDSWLSRTTDKEDPREGVYFTSAIKCFCDDSKSLFKKMGINCSIILKEQIGLVKPQIIITLGADSFDAVKFINESFNKAQYKIYKSNEYALVTNFDYHFIHVVWPHPSPLNRNLNKSDIDKLMEPSIEFIKEIRNNS